MTARYPQWKNGSWDLQDQNLAFGTKNADGDTMGIYNDIIVIYKDTAGIYKDPIGIWEDKFGELKTLITRCG